MLPLLVLRRLDAVLEPTKRAWCGTRRPGLEAAGYRNPDPILQAAQPGSRSTTQPVDARRLLAG